MKTCAKCKTEKRLDDFSKSELNRSGPNCSRCKACVAERARAWYERPGNAAKAKAGAKKRRKPHGPAKMAYYRKHRYGLEAGDFDRMLAAQSSACAICDVEFSATPHVDHCHDTGRVRGLLCGPCNRAIGLLKDDPKLVAAALVYLAR